MAAVQNKFRTYNWQSLWVSEAKQVQKCLEKAFCQHVTATLDKGQRVCSLLTVFCSLVSFYLHGQVSCCCSNLYSERRELQSSSAVKWENTAPNIHEILHKNNTEKGREHMYSTMQQRTSHTHTVDFKEAVNNWHYSIHRGGFSVMDNTKAKHKIPFVLVQTAVCGIPNPSHPCYLPEDT